MFVVTLNCWIVFSTELWCTMVWETVKCNGCYCITCSEALTVHMTSLECNTDDELESAVGDLDEVTDTETESLSDGMLTSISWMQQCRRA